MTTNSPNPVDGDVQALIEHCKENIDTLTVALKHCDQEEADEIYRNLELQKVALAALTARPKGFIEYKSNGTDCFIMKGFYMNGLVEGDKLYTTPPAQLLRPVELPKRKSMLTREEIDDDYATCMAVPIDDVIAALENAGVPYEVKS